MAEQGRGASAAAELRRAIGRLAASRCAVLIVDRAGRAAAANARAEALFGYARDELLGLPVDRLLPAGPVRVGRLRRGRLLRARTGARARAPRRDRAAETLALRKDGSALPVAVQTSALATAAGPYVVFDVRAREAPRAAGEGARQAERELAEADAFLDSIIENIPLMIFVKDAAELRFQRLNRAGEELLGTPRAQLLGKTDFDLFPFEQARHFQRKDRETLAGAAIVDIEEEPIQTPHGERFLHTRKVVVCDAQGRPRHLLGISEDVTAQRALARELHESNRELERRVRERTAELDRLSEQREDLLRALSHDLRSPLTVIRLQAQRLALRAENPDAERGLEAIITSTGRIETMIRDLVDVARVEGGQQERAEIELAPFLHELLARARDVLDAPRVRADIAPGLLAAGDPTSLERIFTNLLSNALKYSPAGTLVRVNGERVGAEVVVSVADVGAGIAADELPRLFDRYWRARRTAGADGLGLGLYITKQLVAAQGGRIWVDSELGKGSTFRFTLPAAPAPSAAPP